MSMSGPELHMIRQSLCQGALSVFCTCGTTTLARMGGRAPTLTALGFTRLSSRSALRPPQILLQTRQPQREMIHHLPLIAIQLGAL